MLTCASLHVESQSSNLKFQQYIEQYRGIAIEQMQKWNIPASITLAQALLESGAGQSMLAKEGNNHFGIKCHDWTGRTIYRDDDAKGECFRAYASARESFEDHSKFLASGQRYKSLFALPVTDYKGWAKGLKAAGYATNPRYAETLIGIIESYGLAQYDSQPQHSIYIYNKNCYLYARQGDTYRSIAEETGISARKLAKCNERSKNDRLTPGEVVWLKKKQARAPREMKHQLHTVQAGESMYSIAQKYGIRLKSLYRLNGLQPDYSLRVGDQLRLR